MKASEFLRDARARLEGGWTKGEFEDTQGNVCILGAVMAADRVAAPRARYGAVYWAANQALMDHLPGGGPLSNFNDSPTTTKQDVLNLFDKAIAGLEEVGN